MPTLDWIFLAVLLFSLLLGAWRGLLYEVFSVLSWIAAFFLAQWFAADAGQWIPISGDADTVRYAGGFVLIFVATVFAGGLVAFVVKKLAAAAGLSPADRMLGALFGLVRGMLLLLAVTVVVGMSPLHTASWWTGAMGPRMTGAVLSGLKPVLPEEFGKYLP